MIKNAFHYVTRKRLKSIIIMLVIIATSTLCLISLSIKDATNKASKETFKNITNSFSMEINRRVNFGTPRGGGNIKGQDIKKIAESKDIDSYVKRINSVADLVDNDIIEAEETLSNQSPERAKNFKRAVMLTGVNDSSKENKFISKAYKLSSGKHLNEKDKNKILMHKDLAKKNNLKIGDKIKIKSNLFDADNEKKANEKVEVEIIGLFDGHNKGGVTAAQELYENTLITDLNTAAKVYGNTEDTAIYQDATFFVKGDKNLDKVIKNIEKLDIDWQQYNLIKSTNNYPALQQSISGIYNIANNLFITALLFAGITVSLLLFLWINARKKEIAILLSLGISKAKIFTQFVIELVLISIPAYITSYFLAIYTASIIGNNILNKVTNTISKQIAKQTTSSQLGGGAEAEGFNKTLTSLEINISPKLMIYVVLFITIVLVISLLIATSKTLKKNPKELLTDNK
jgi:putative ABC transport system permease protein